MLGTINFPRATPQCAFACISAKTPMICVDQRAINATELPLAHTSSETAQDSMCIKHQT